MWDQRWENQSTWLKALYWQAVGGWENARQALGECSGEAVLEHWGGERQQAHQDGERAGEEEVSGTRTTNKPEGLDGSG